MRKEIFIYQVKAEYLKDELIDHHNVMDVEPINELI